MNVLRFAAVLVLVLVSLTTLGGAAQAGVEMTAVSSCAMDGARSGAEASAILCVRYFCPVYPDFGCSCELVWCNGDYVCGEPR